MEKIKIYIYHDSKRNESIIEFINNLKKVNCKSNRILLNKVNDYIQALSVYGVENLTSQYVKHIEGPIWELRPKNIRILFGVVSGNKYVLLHLFEKKTIKTPRREIEKALHELSEYLEAENEN